MSVVARYSTAVECAGDPYRRCTAWGFWMCGARNDDERKTRVWGREKGMIQQHIVDNKTRVW